jgi:glucose-1-phosphate thymidylyltransferase
VKLIESRQNLKIGCIEETAYQEKFINKTQYIKIIQNVKNLEYQKYLMSNLKI